MRRLFRDTHVGESHVGESKASEGGTETADGDVEDVLDYTEASANSVSERYPCSRVMHIYILCTRIGFPDGHVNENHTLHYEQNSPETFLGSENFSEGATGCAST